MLQCLTQASWVPESLPGDRARAALKGCWTHSRLDQKSVLCMKSLKLLSTGYSSGSSASLDLTSRSACCCWLLQGSHLFRHPYSTCLCPVPTARCGNFYLLTLRLVAVQCSLYVSQDLLSCTEDINLGRVKRRKRKFQASQQRGKQHSPQGFLWNEEVWIGTSGSGEEHLLCKFEDWVH